jgi:hypothetical protein
MTGGLRTALLVSVALAACAREADKAPPVEPHQSTPPPLSIAAEQADASVDDAAPSSAAADASPPPSNLEITLERTVCYGLCPAYKVTLRGDGTVLYEGDKYVKVHGKATDNVPPADVAALAKEFADAGFDKLTVPDPCSKGIATDNPTNRLTVVRGGNRRTVVHYLGNQCAPPELSVLADAVDKTAHTDRWIRCGSGPRAYCSKP